MTEELSDEEIMKHLPPQLRPLFPALPKDVKMELATKHVPSLKHIKIIEPLSLEQLEAKQYDRPKRKSSYLHRRSKDEDGDSEIHNLNKSPVKEKRLVLRRKKRTGKDYISIEYRSDTEEQKKCKLCSRKLLNHTTVMEHTKTGELVCTKCFDEKYTSR